MANLVLKRKVDDVFSMTLAPPTSNPAPATDSTSRIGTDPILPLLLRFSIPSIVGMLVYAFYNIVDRMFIGHGIGSQGLAGVTLDRKSVV